MFLGHLNTSSGETERIRIQLTHDKDEVVVWFDFTADSMHYTLDGSIPTVLSTSITRGIAFPNVVFTKYATTIKCLVTLNGEDSIYTAYTPPTYFLAYRPKNDVFLNTRKLRIYTLDDPTGTGGIITGITFNEVPDLGQNQPTVIASSTDSGYAPENVLDLNNTTHWKPVGNDNYLEFTFPYTQAITKIEVFTDSTDPKTEGPNGYRIVYQDVNTLNWITAYTLHSNSIQSKAYNGTNNAVRLQIFPNFRYGYRIWRVTFTGDISLKTADLSINNAISITGADDTWMVLNINSSYPEPGVNDTFASTSPVSLVYTLASPIDPGLFVESVGVHPAIVVEYLDGTGTWIEVYNFAGGGSQIQNHLWTLATKSTQVWEPTVTANTISVNNRDGVILGLSNIVDHGSFKFDYPGNPGIARQIENYEIITGVIGGSVDYIDDNDVTHTFFIGGNDCYELEFTDVGCDPALQNTEIGNGDTYARDSTYSETTDGEQTAIEIDSPLYFNTSNLNNTTPDTYSLVFKQ